ncbi:hypothetical protein LJC59_09025, partial [Desulfovibrio sp. OttesenSCG-928-A18]|nr:hypothetical protein [Desulfovibrio sp. OttesenSCG-928-A18]
ERYVTVIIAAQRFLFELEGHVARLGLPGKLHRENAEDEGFALFECLAAIFREAALQENTQLHDAVQVELLRYFESSGHWDLHVRDEISQYYWRIIPETVEKYIALGSRLAAMGRRPCEGKIPPGENGNNMPGGGSHESS